MKKIKESLRNHLLHIGICAFILFSSPILAAQISGRITDEEGNGLSFANLIVKGTSLGTSANADGYFTLDLPVGKYLLQAQYIGFKQALWEVTISHQTKIEHNFLLTLQGYELAGFEIKSGGEDPAYRIIRNAIKRRTFHLKQLESFQSSIYLKGVLRNRKTPSSVLGIKLKEEDKKEMNNSMGLDSLGKGLLYLCEQIADYYTEGSKEKLIIRSVKESGNPNGIGLGTVPPIINFYKNNVNVFSKNEFVSPISGTALNYYKYKLLGNFEENGHKIYKINVIPKRNYERCFIGDIYIVDEEWAIHSLQLIGTKNQGLDFLDTIKTEQSYIPLQKDIWVIKNQVFYPSVNVFGFDIAGDFVTIYNDQKVNEPIADSIFNKRITVSYTKGSNKKDDNYWSAARPIKLEEEELKNYTYRDSIYKIETDPNRIDSLRKRGNKVKLSEVFLFGTVYNSKQYKNVFRFTPVLFDVNFNTVEGLNYSPNLTIKHKIDTGKLLTWENNLRYGFSNTHFNAKSLLRYTINSKSWDKRYWEFALTGGKYISQFNNDQPVVELPNTYSSLVQQRNLFKIYERWVSGLQIIRDYGNGFDWLLSAQYEQRLPLENSTDYSFATKSKVKSYTENEGPLNQNITKHNVFILKVAISYQPGVHFTQLPDKKVPNRSNAPIFTLNLQKGIPQFINSISDYTKWDFQIQHKFNLNRKGTIEYLATVGGFLDKKNVPTPDMNHIFGNQFHIASPFLHSFQLAPYYLFSNTEKLYTTLHTEYKLDGFISNKIPLLRQAQWYFVMGTNTFFVNQNQYYTEAFLGLDNLGYKVFRGLRVDFVKGWDSYKDNYFDFRIGLKSNSIKIGVERERKAKIF